MDKLTPEQALELLGMLFVFTSRIFFKYFSFLKFKIFLQVKNYISPPFYYNKAERLLDILVVCLSILY